ncbi:MAG: transcriptional regulator [Cetobacterium sp.]
MENNGLLTVENVVELCKVSKNTAYKLMREVNDDLKGQGYIVIRGRVNKNYLLKKLGIGAENVSN